MKKIPNLKALSHSDALTESLYVHTCSLPLNQPMLYEENVKIKWHLLASDGSDSFVKCHWMC